MKTLALHSSAVVNTVISQQGHGFQVWDLSVWILHVLHVSAWLHPRIQCGKFGTLNWLWVQVERIVCLSTCDPVINWCPGCNCLPSPEDSWDRHPQHQP